MDSDYWNAMDTKEKFGPGVDVIGSSTPPMKDQLQELKSKIFKGLSHVELGFWGKGKGSRTQGNITPETYGKEEREAIRELAKVNEVSLSTHASPMAGNLAGLGEQGFSDQAREQTLNEIKKAVDFAADVTQGGPVVVHTGEYPRPILEYEKEKFQAYSEEKEKSPVYLVDIKTGKLIPFLRDTEVPVPVKDENGKYAYDKKEGEIKRFKVETKSYKDYIKGSKDRQRILKELEQEKILDSKEIEKLKQSGEEATGQLFYLDHMKRQVDKYDWEERRWLADTEKMEEAIEQENKIKQKLEKAREDFLKTKDRQRAADILNILNKDPVIEKLGGIDRANPEESIQKAISGINSEIKRTKTNLEYQEDAAVNYAKEIKTTKEQMKQIKPVEDFAIKKTAETISNAAMYAYEVEKKIKPKDNLFISPENIFPEQYGAHPKELKKIVLESRKAMVNKLKHKMSEEQAKKIADNHIKATFDIGHAYIWKKYFKGKDKDFNKWVIEQAKKLQKQGIIGHVHLSDNFGYEDEHLSPGDGAVPIKEFVEEVRKQGYKGQMIVEAGGQPQGQDWRATTSAWKTLNSPIYRVDGYQQAWSEIESGYFGRTGSPSYLVGEIAPSKDWAFWTETPIE